MLNQNSSPSPPNNKQAQHPTYPPKAFIDAPHGQYIDYRNANGRSPIASPQIDSNQPLMGMCD